MHGIGSACLTGGKGGCFPDHGKQAMRYVIGICVVTAFLLWDFWYNEGRYVTYTVMELRRLTAMVGA